MAGTGPAVTLAAGAAVLPLVGVSMLLLLLGGAGARGAPPAGCGGTTVGSAGGSAGGSVALDAEQMSNARTIVGVTAGRGLPVFAAVVAVAASYTESRLRNSAVATDRDSEGLFQQRISLYTKPVADDPVRATNAFLDRLVRVLDWPATPAGVDAQTVQRSAYPDRYAPTVGFAEQLVGQFWPSAAATGLTTSGPATPGATASSPPAPSTSPPARRAGRPRARTSPASNAAPRAGPPTPTPTPAASATGPLPAACQGGALPAGPAPPGGGGSNVAGTTRIPAGLVVTGSPRGAAAVTFALGQLGKPYVYGAAGPDSWDCSGLTVAAWATAGVALPHWTVTQAQAGTPEPTDLSAAAGGDLVLIAGSDGTAAAPGHVGMIAGYADAPDGRHIYLVQAAMTGIPVELTDATEWRGQIVAVRHLA